MKNPRPVEELDYEEAFCELEEIVGILERGEQTLEETLALFERGQMLAKHCETLLDQAELHVKMLNGDELTDYHNNP